MSQDWRCPVCHNTNVHDEEHCHSCGQELAEAVEQGWIKEPK